MTSYKDKVLAEAERAEATTVARGRRYYGVLAVAERNETAALLAAKKAAESLRLASGAGPTLLAILRADRIAYLSEDVSRYLTLYGPRSAAYKVAVLALRAATSRGPVTAIELIAREEAAGNYLPDGSLRGTRAGSDIEAGA